MRAPARVRLERLEKLIQRLSHESEEGGTIIVEGQRDRDSLREMGISGTILCLQSSRKNTTAFAESLAGDTSVIVLTDFDREGVSLAKRLARTLSSRRMRTNLVLWREFRGLTRSDVRSVEELPRYHERMRSEVLLGVHPLEHAHYSPYLAELRKVRRKSGQSC